MSGGRGRQGTSGLRRSAWRSGSRDLMHQHGSQGTTPLNSKVYEAATQVSSFSWKFQKWRLAQGGTNNQDVPGPLRRSSARQTVARSIGAGCSRGLQERSRLSPGDRFSLAFSCASSKLQPLCSFSCCRSMVGLAPLLPPSSQGMWE